MIDRYGMVTRLIKQVLVEHQESIYNLLWKEGSRKKMQHFSFCRVITVLGPILDAVSGWWLKLNTATALSLFAP